MKIMKPFRERIDALDDKIIDLLAQRTDIIREVGQFKYENDLPAVLPDRVTEVRERAAERAAEKGLDADLVRGLYQTLIEYSCDLEEEIKAALRAEDEGEAEKSKPSPQKAASGG